MHTRETLAAGGSNFSDTLHIAFSAFSVLIIIAAIGITAFAYKNLFRLYSIVTIVLLCAFGILTSIDAPEIVKNGPTPWIGIWERILIGVYLLWICIFALKLLKTARK